MGQTAKLDKLEVAERSARKRRTSEKDLHAGDDAVRKSYSPVGRDSIAMYSMTNKTFEHDADEKEDEDDDDITDMPPLDGDDDDGHITPDEKENDNDASSVIRTPGPVEEPNTDDKAFIKRSSESDSAENADDALDDDDADYDPADDDRSDDDADDDDDE